MGSMLPVSTETQSGPIKPGVKTSEAWTTWIFIAANVLAAIAGILPAQWATVASGIAAAMYSYSRGQAKASPPITLGK